MLASTGLRKKYKRQLFCIQERSQLTKTIFLESKTWILS